MTEAAGEGEKAVGGHGGWVRWRFGPYRVEFVGSITVRI